MTTIAQALRAPVSPDVRLTAPQVVAYHALRRHVATLMGDAELLANLGEKPVGDELVALAGILDALSVKYIAAAQRLVITPGEVPH